MKPTAKVNLDSYVMVGCMLPPETNARVIELARQEGIGKSAWTRRLVLQHLEALDAGAEAR